MSSKSKSGSDETTANSVSAMAALQASGFGNMMGMGSAWFEAFSDMGAEFLGFLAARIREDVKTQHKILHCHDLRELQHIQAEFVQTAIDQYQAETGKLIEMSSTAFKDTLKSTSKS